MRVRILIFLFLMLAGFISHAQFSPVQTSDGKSSLIIPQGATVNFNFSTSKVTAGSQVYGSENLQLSLFGSASATEGVSALFDGQSWAPEASLGASAVFFTTSRDTSNDRLSYFFGTATHSWANYKLYDSAASLDKIVFKDKDRSASIMLGYNTTNQKSIAFGIAAQGIFSSNNFLALTKYTVYDQLEFTDGTVNKLVVSNEEKVRGTRDQFNGSFSELNLMGDFLWWPAKLESTLAIGVHARSNFREIAKPSFDTGLGFYITKAGAEDADPTAIVGGITIENKDMFEKRSDKSFGERTTINIVVGYTFKY